MRSSSDRSELVRNFNIGLPVVKVELVSEVLIGHWLQRDRSASVRFPRYTGENPAEAPTPHPSCHTDISDFRLED
jgi:hypothetical protein